MTTLDKPAAGRAVARLVPFLLLVLACWTSLLTLASPVPSEAPVLVSSSPGNGEVSRPDDIVLTFDRPVPAGLATIRMTDPYKRPVDPGRPVHAGDRDDTVSVPVPKQKYAGTYTIAWSVPVDGQDPATGTFTFDLASRSPVQAAPVLDARPGLAVTIAHGAAQFVAFAALALLAGAVLFVAVVWPDGAESTVVRRLIARAWGGVLGGTVLSFLTFGPYAAKVPLSDVVDGGLLSGAFESETGQTYLARLLVVAVAGIGIAQFLSMAPADSVRERRLRGGTVLACTAAAVATWSFTATGSVVVSVVQLTALAVLAGVLVMPRADGVPATARRPRTLVVVCTGVLAVTAAARIWPELGSLSGWLWAGFAVLVLVLGVLSLARRLPLAQTGVAVLLLGVAAALSVAPPVTASGPQAPLVRLAFATGQLDLAIVPAKVGANQVHVTVLNAEIAGGAELTAELAPVNGSALPVRFEPDGPGRLVGSVTVPSPGQWELALTVRSGTGAPEVIYGVVDVR